MGLPVSVDNACPRLRALWPSPVGVRGTVHFASVVLPMPKSVVKLIRLFCPAASTLGRGRNARTAAGTHAGRGDRTPRPGPKTPNAGSRGRNAERPGRGEPGGRTSRPTPQPAQPARRPRPEGHAGRRRSRRSYCACRLSVEHAGQAASVSLRMNMPGKRRSGRRVLGSADTAGRAGSTYQDRRVMPGEHAPRSRIGE